MSKKIRFAFLTFALSGIVALSAALSACTVKTNHPRAVITVSFNDVDYDIEYTLYRNMYPQTVEHFIKLADNHYYDNTIIHNYSANDWSAGAYGYNLEDSSYSDAFESGSSALSEYLTNNSKEAEYYSLINSLFDSEELTPSVYKKISYNAAGDELLDKADALPTVIGEFSDNNHKIEKGALTAAYGTLKMFYYDKGDAQQKVAVRNSFGEIMERDYNYNCATGIFTMQVGNTSAYSAARYTVFAKLRNDNALQKLEDLTDAISDYITDELSGSSGRFTLTVPTMVENLDTFAQLGGREIETTFPMTAVPLIIKTVKITKY